MAKGAIHTANSLVPLAALAAVLCRDTRRLCSTTGGASGGSGRSVASQGTRKPSSIDRPSGSGGSEHGVSGYLDVHERPNQAELDAHVGCALCSVPAAAVL